MLTSCHLIIKVSYFQANRGPDPGYQSLFSPNFKDKQEGEKSFLPIQRCDSAHFPEITDKSEYVRNIHAHNDMMMSLGLKLLYQTDSKEGKRAHSQTDITTQTIFTMVEKIPRTKP